MARLNDRDSRERGCVLCTPLQNGSCWSVGVEGSSEDRNLNHAQGVLRHLVIFDVGNQEGIVEVDARFFFGKPDWVHRPRNAGDVNARQFGVLVKVDVEPYFPAGLGDSYPRGPGTAPPAGICRAASRSGRARRASFAPR